MNLAKGLPQDPTEGLNFEQWLTVVLGDTLSDLVIASIVSVTLLGLLAVGFYTMKLLEKQ